ncbi:transposase [Skermanella pratensis]|nr:transposase [Skermanella pratensis]
MEAFNRRRHDMRQLLGGLFYVVRTDDQVGAVQPGDDLFVPCGSGM